MNIWRYSSARPKRGRGMDTLNILFLGAAKRVSLLERFVDAARRLNVRLVIFSLEKDEGFCPISHLAVLKGAPKFTAPEFQDALDGFVRANDIHIVIPNMDAATEALALYKETRAPQGCWCVVSTHALAKAMHDKLLSDAFFSAHQLPAPADTPGRFPKIVKPVFGFGGKGITRVANQAELSLALATPVPVMVQDFITGPETTADIYVSPVYGLLGMVLRDRVEVSDGEVMICHTRPPSTAERDLLNRIAAIPGWEGCITIQYIRDNGGAPYMVEINPRFGGGATASIEAGLDMAYYVLAERLGQRVQAAPHIRQLIMSRARRDFFQDLPAERAEGKQA